MQLSCLSNRRLLQQKGAGALLKRVGDVSAARAPQQGPSSVWLLGTTPWCHPPTPFFSIIVGQHGRLQPQNAASQRGRGDETSQSLTIPPPKNKGLAHTFTLIHLGDQSPLAQGMSAAFAEC